MLANHIESLAHCSDILTSGSPSSDIMRVRISVPFYDISKLIKSCSSRLETSTFDMPMGDTGDCIEKFQQALCSTLKSRSINRA